MEGGERINLNYLLQKEKFDKIRSVLKKFGIERIAPIYDYFKGEFSYDEIRLARIIMKSNELTNETNIGLEKIDENNL